MDTDKDGLGRDEEMAGRTQSEPVVSRPVGRYVLAGLAGFCCIGAVAVTSLNSAVTPQEDVIQISSGDLNFGFADRISDFEHTFRLKNRSSDPIRLEGFQASCACTSFSPESAVLAAGEQLDVMTTIDLTRYQSGIRSDGTNSFSVDFSAKLARGLVGPWTISGTVRSMFHATSRKVWLGEVRVGTNEPLQHEFDVGALPDARVLEVSASEEYVATAMRSHEDSSQLTTVDLDVDVAALTVGSHQFDVHVSGEKAGSRGMATVCRFFFRVVDSVRVQPESLMLSRSEGEAAYTGIIRVVSDSDKPVRVERVQVAPNSEDLVISEIPSSDGAIGPQYYRVVARPPNLNHVHYWDVEFLITDAGQEEPLTARTRVILAGTSEIGGNGIGMGIGMGDSK